ncbi:MAG TPA: MerR family transcriptional regulator [Pseudomonas xinjiangensis]|uniref:MerR family transcriptional regulator n=2 Tax=root TaxID=1 RepID=A0A7V1BMF2_9GAMM|nr:MerR family transcriptional regulator [Halopseudomonas xinjiangensis]HEC49237.1 MerR family transcriptional regulator [Halopseudomonas xinjiangensis]
MSLSTTDMLPIRDVSRVTGVNAVTLRAWERRYGLIKPHRTPKGHRLYTQDNVAQIQHILSWLNRGVAVGQVKALLNSPSNTPVSEEDSPWRATRAQFMDALLSFDTARFDQLYNQSMAAYPTATVCSQLLQPVLDQLQQRWQGQFGSHLEEVFIHTRLRTKMATRIYQNNCHLNAPPVVIASLSNEHCEPGMWLLAAMLSADSYRVDTLEWEVPASELTLLADRTNPQALVLFSSQAVPAHQLRRHLPKLVQNHSMRIFVAGHAAVIHAQEWQAMGVGILSEQTILAHSILLDRLRISA